MNLKLVVASMSVLGLVSCPVLAAKHKHKSHHQAVAAEHHDYKDMGSLPVQPAKDVICTVSATSVMMAEMTQNANRSLPNPCTPDWYKRISLSGGANFDIGKFGNRNANYMGENYQRFSINDVYVNLSADVNDWTHAFASLSYNTATVNPNPETFKGVGSAEYDAAYSNNINGAGNSQVQVEQAYVTVSDFDNSAFFGQVGKSFQDFSRYDLHPITESLTQQMSEVLATSLKVGFINQGFTGSIYAFDDPINKNNNSNPTTNYGASLGYDQNGSDFGWDVGLGYLYNMIGANNVAYDVVNFTGTNTYHNRVGAVALYGDLNSGPFTVNARYTQAVQRFNVNDLTQDGVADLAVGSALIGSGTQVTPAGSASGAKPWAAGVQAGYGFDAWGKNQNIYLGYQASREAAGLNLPESRWLAGYDIDMFGKNTTLGIEWDHDMAYSTSNGGTNNNTNLVSVRSSVKFG
jgi:hypothetical protein